MLGRWRTGLDFMKKVMVIGDVAVEKYHQNDEGQAEVTKVDDMGPQDI
jgi:hypothetical protein